MDVFQSLNYEQHRVRAEKVFGCIGLVCGLVFTVLMAANTAIARENPDTLYKQGRFAEAEKAYADSDMDRPKDIRFRYNRGCAAYQNSNYQGASAAFSSVLRRTKNNQTLFRAAYNLGNTAFKQGHFAAAANYYKQAILYDSSNSDTRYNLELALRALKKQQERANAQDQSRKGSQKKEKGKQGQEEKQIPDKGPGKSSQQESTDNTAPKSQDKKSQQGASGPKEPEKSDQQATKKSPETGQYEAQSPQDLSGQLESMQSLPEQPGEKQRVRSAISIDRKKAEALLDNIKEDRLRFFRYQVPEGKKAGVGSGKDW